MIIWAMYTNGTVWRGEAIDWGESPKTFADKFGIAAIKLFFEPPYTTVIDGHSWYGFAETLDHYRVVTWDEYTDHGQELLVSKAPGGATVSKSFARGFHPLDLPYRQGAWQKCEEYLALLDEVRAWQL